jgi:hypothetical protein
MKVRNMVDDFICIYEIEQWNLLQLQGGAKGGGGGQRSNQCTMWIYLELSQWISPYNEYIPIKMKKIYSLKLGKIHQRICNHKLKKS